MRPQKEIKKVLIVIFSKRHIPRNVRIIGFEKSLIAASFFKFKTIKLCNQGLNREKCF
jgi:hypothetical protein